jgi:hypothetical protein
MGRSPIGTLRPLHPTDLGWAERECVCALKRGGNCATSRAVVVLIKRA